MEKMRENLKYLSSTLKTLISVMVVVKDYKVLHGSRYEVV